MSMKLLIVSQYFFPEEFKINDLTEELVKKGHEVTVLTGKPNYPKGHFFEGYRFWGIDKEEYKGAAVVRVPVIRRGRGGALRLMLNYLSFVFFGRWFVRTHLCNFDSVFVWETSPITQAYPGILASRKSGARLSMWVQDLWPESVSATTSIKSKVLMSWLDRMVAGIYSKCDTIFVQSEAFKDSICAKGDFAGKIVYAPNWAEDVFDRESLIDRTKYAGMFPPGFRVMFAGNLGEAQDLQNLLNAATITRNCKDIHWFFIGDGRARMKVEERVKDEGLADTVHLLGRYPTTEMPSFFCHADAMLVSLKDEYIFSLTIPSKIQAYMASGKPILTMLSGEGNRVVSESGCGVVACSGDYEQLARNIMLLYGKQESELIEMGKKGLSYYHQHFEKESVVRVIESHL